MPTMNDLMNAAGSATLNTLPQGQGMLINILSNLISGSGGGGNGGKLRTQPQEQAPAVPPRMQPPRTNTIGFLQHAMQQSPTGVMPDPITVSDMNYTQFPEYVRALAERASGQGGSVTPTTQAAQPMTPAIATQTTNTYSPDPAKAMQAMMEIGAKIDALPIPPMMKAAKRGQIAGRLTELGANPETLRYWVSGGTAGLVQLQQDYMQLAGRTAGGGSESSTEKLERFKKQVDYTRQYDKIDAVEKAQRAIKSRLLTDPRAAEMLGYGPKGRFTIGPLSIPGTAKKFNRDELVDVLNWIMTELTPVLNTPEGDTQGAVIPTEEERKAYSSIPTVR